MTERERTLPDILAGFTYIILCVALLPVYIRFLYIFITKAKYRSLECYRIMVQMGIIQCTTMSPGFITFGLAKIIFYDWRLTRLANILIVLDPAGARAETVLGLVLAMNRLKIICGLRYPNWIHTVVAAVAWLLGLCYVVLLSTTHFSYMLEPWYFLPKYDTAQGFTKELQFYGYYVYATPMVLTLMIYIYIIGYLIRLKHVHRAKIHDRESSIFIYAVSKFIVDFSQAAVYNHVHLPDTPIFNFSMSIWFILSSLFLTPALYFVLYKNLRKEFFTFRRNYTLPIRSISSGMHS
uniref:G protein-coupled receptor n=1 Tax=Steinernema glaseri TaxID=37863 RepID=A0A1I7YF82_9BILA